MSSTALSPGQLIRNDHIHSKQLPGRGNGLVAARDFDAGEQLLFVQKPLILALETSRLQEMCYQCLREEVPAEAASESKEEKISLKACTGCHTVKFCGKQCQILAWNEYHKYECKIYAKLHPRILPSTVRAVLRLLKRRKAGTIAESEWQQLQKLESHQDDLSNAGGERWQNLFLMVKAVKTYSGTDEPLETILKICCILMLNSFTLTNSTFDPLGIILHPLPALMNHSCTPNAFVRFDVPPPSPTPPNQTPRYGSISVHALHPISSSTEITISYIDSALPFSNRQSDLQSRYFFTCSCPLCLQGESSVTDRFLPITTSTPTSDKSTLLQETEQTLLSSQSKPNTEAAHIPHFQTSLSQLSRSKIWPLYRYPYPQLRHQLILGLISTGRFDEALGHSAVIVRRVDTVLYTDKSHPMRLVHIYRLVKLVRWRMDSITILGPLSSTRGKAIEGAGGSPSTPDPRQWSNELQSLATAMCYLVDELMSGTSFNDAVSGSNGPRSKAGKSGQTSWPTGHFESLVQVVYDELHLAQIPIGGQSISVWEGYKKQIPAVRSKAENWLDSIVQKVLDREENA